MANLFSAADVFPLLPALPSYISHVFELTTPDDSIDVSREFNPRIEASKQTWSSQEEEQCMIWLQKQLTHGTFALLKTSNLVTAV